MHLIPTNNNIEKRILFANLLLLSIKTQIRMEITKTRKGEESIPAQAREDIT